MGDTTLVDEQNSETACHPIRGLVRSFMKLFGGSLGAHLLVFLSAPVLSRCFSPAEFGILGMFLAVVAILSTTSTLRLEMAITLTRSRRAAEYLFWMAIAISFVLCLVMGLVLWLLPPTLFNRQIQEVLAVCWLVPAGVMMRSITSVLTKIAGIEHAFGRVGGGLVLGRMVDVGIKLGLGVALNLGWLGLAVGVVAGEIVTSATIGFTLRRWNWMPPRNWSRYVRLANRYSNFPRYNLPAAFCASVSKNLPALVFLAVFGPVVAGLIELTQRVLGRPISLFGQHLYTVFYQHSADEARRGASVGVLVERILPVLFVLLLVPFALITIWGPDLFALTFGQPWREAGMYAAILAPAWFLRSIASPVRVFNTYQRQGLALRWQVLTLLATCFALGAGAWTGSPIVTAALLSTVTFISYGIHLTITVRLSHARWDRIIYGPVLMMTTLWKLVLARVRRRANARG